MGEIRSLGILVNELYIGRVRWNRWKWAKDPDSETRKPFARQREEQIVRDTPELRIVPQLLWDRVQARLSEIAHKTDNGTRKSYAGMGSRYLLSGLLTCSCGGRFIVRGPARYGCSFHANRGTTICANSLTVRRDILEARVLEAIGRELLSDAALEFLANEVNRTLAERAQAMASGTVQTELRRELHRKNQELENIKRAIRQGIVTSTTLAMLEETEVRIRELSARLKASETSLARRSSMAVVPGRAKEYLQNLRAVLSRDVQKARQMVRLLVEGVNILPIGLGTPEAHLEAEIVGNAAGLITIMRPAVGEYGSGGWI